MDTDLVHAWTETSPLLPSTIVAPSQLAAATGPVTVTAEYAFGVPWPLIASRPWTTVVVLPRWSDGLPDTVAVFDAGSNFYPVTASARALGIRTFQPSAQGPRSGVDETVSSRQPISDGNAAVPTNEKVPTLADSDWGTYISSAIFSAGLTSLLWQNIIPGIATGILMVAMLVATDKMFGKNYPQEPS